MSPNRQDLRHMRHALVLAARGLGQVAPNPAVGCVIVAPGGQVVGRGCTGPQGRPHAETQALAQAGMRARGATAYVTLEPCAHIGRTPPCADALIGAGIARVVAALRDPDPRVKGAGFARLREAKVDIETDLLAADAAKLNEGFVRRVEQARPLVTLKIAHSLDGHSAAASGESQWITSEEARRYGHMLRAQHDAILVGIETVLADDPLLTCRLAGLEGRSPLRVVLDSRLRLAEHFRLVQTATAVASLVFTTAAEERSALSDLGVEVLRVGGDARGRPDIDAVLAALAGRGITRLLVEGGASVQASFINRGRADRLEIFSAPMLLGAAGRSSVGALAALGLEEAPRFVRESIRVFGPDVLESYSARA